MLGFPAINYASMTFSFTSAACVPWAYLTPDSRDFDGQPGAPTGMDALVAYLQMRGRQTTIADRPVDEEGAE